MAQYAVEDILDFRIVKLMNEHLHFEYLVKWVGYDTSESTWEHEFDIFSPEIICNFWLKKKHILLKPPEEDDELKTKHNRQQFKELYETGIIPQIPSSTGSGNVPIARKISGIYFDTDSVPIKILDENESEYNVLWYFKSVDKYSNINAPKWQVEYFLSSEVKEFKREVKKQKKLASFNEEISKKEEIPSRSYTIEDEVQELPSRTYDTKSKVEEIPSCSYDMKNKAEEIPSCSYTIEDKIQELLSCSYDTKNKVEEIPSCSYYDTKNKVEEIPSCSYDTKNKVEEIPSCSYDTKNKVEEIPSCSYDTKNKVEEISSCSYDTKNKVEIPSCSYDTPKRKRIIL